MSAAVRQKVLVTLAGGGYENEAKMLLRQLGDGFDYGFVTTRDAAWHAPQLPLPGEVHVLPTLTRKLDPSRLKAALRFLYALAMALPLVRRERPAAIIGVASPICLPLFVWGRLFGARCVFIESITRTSKLSLTGRIASRAHLVDRVYVQWPDLRDCCPHAIYQGTVV